MNSAPRVVLVTRPTPLEQLVASHGTLGQARFFLKTRGRPIDPLLEMRERQLEAMPEEHALAASLSMLSGNLQFRCGDYETAAAAYGTGQWTIYYIEVYVFVGFIYFIFVFSLSRYGAYLEKRLRVGHG